MTTKKASSNREVSCCAILKDGMILMGKRRDNNRWTFPGGHLDEGESPLDGCIREVFEESGITLAPHQLTHLESKGGITTPKGKLKVHGYKVVLPKDTKTTIKNDPDEEVYKWQWISLDGGIKKEIWDNLHVKPKHNVLTQALNLEPPKGASEKTASECDKKSFQKFLLDDNRFKTFEMNEKTA